MKRRLSALCLALALLVTLCACGFASRTPADGLAVYFLDVGQADSALVVCDGAAMLIDGGNVADAQYVVSALAQRGVTALQAVVATHCDEDHCGGLAGVLAKYPAERVLCSVTEYDTKAFTDFVKYADVQGRAIEQPQPGEHWTLGGAAVTVLGPLRDYEDNNENSVVLRIDYGETSFLFTGDIGLEAEDELVESGADLSATVLKVAHHGSRGSSGYVFLRAAAPQYGVISVSADNSYGHPTEQALSRLRDAGAVVSIFFKIINGRPSRACATRACSFTGLICRARSRRSQTARPSRLRPSAPLRRSRSIRPSKTPPRRTSATPSPRSSTATPAAASPRSRTGSRSTPTKKPWSQATGPIRRVCPNDFVVM